VVDKLGDRLDEAAVGSVRVLIRHPRMHLARQCVVVARCPQGRGGLDLAHIGTWLATEARYLA
jgi:hypothetical protein